MKRGHRPKGSSFSPGEELTSGGSVGSLYPTTARSYQSAVEEVDLKKLR